MEEDIEMVSEIMEVLRHSSYYKMYPELLTKFLSKKNLKKINKGKILH